MTLAMRDSSLRYAPPGMTRYAQEALSKCSKRNDALRNDEIRMTNDEIRNKNDFTR